MFDHFLFSDKERVIELNGRHKVDGFVLELLKVENNRINEMFNIDLNLNKDIQHFPPGLGDRHKTRVPIMHKQITLHQIRRNIINTTCPIRDIPHDNYTQLDLIDLHTEGFQNVSDDTRV